MKPGALKKFAMLSRLAAMLFAVGFVCLAACAPAAEQSSQPQDLLPRVAWSGDYPVAALDRLPAGQQQNRVGYIGDAETFAGVWRNFMPEETPPVVDFDSELVIFSRNLVYYNRTNIFRVTLTAGIAEILAMETMSAMPIEDRVAMAMAVIGRAGVKAIRLDETTTLHVD